VRNVLKRKVEQYYFTPFTYKLRHMNLSISKVGSSNEGMSHEATLLLFAAVTQHSVAGWSLDAWGGCGLPSVDTTFSRPVN